MSAPGSPPPFQPLDQRLAGAPIAEVLRPGVPLNLVRALRDWLRTALRNRADLALTVLLRLDWATNINLSYPEILSRVTPDDDLLIAADAVIQLHPDWQEEFESDEEALYPGGLFDSLVRLEQFLISGSSELRVDFSARRLVRRVDETVTAAAVKAAENASTEASVHLKAAWAEVYGVNPDPDSAYREAVRAVEAVACPLVLPAAARAGKATLGTVIGELRGNAAHLWRIVLPDSAGQVQDVSRFLGMLEMLWDGQVSRHAGGEKNRRQTQAEAEAAVHLAAIIVQWFAVGAVQRI